MAIQLVLYIPYTKLLAAITPVQYLPNSQQTNARRTKMSNLERGGNDQAHLHQDSAVHGIAYPGKHGKLIARKTNWTSTCE